jgi:hypothetical protein
MNNEVERRVRESTEVIHLAQFAAKAEIVTFRDITILIKLSGRIVENSYIGTGRGEDRPLLTTDLRKT